jgi:glycerol-3-phosphate O-acyltransferase / dihydroxyacetone phosphate acyltransferase
VRIVPCGLTYHRRDRLRSRVLVQFGAPIVVDAARAAALQADPKGAAKALTADIEAAMRALTINVPDWDTLRVLDGVRRLYEPDDVKLTLADRAEIMRRFVSHWEKLKDVPEVAAFYRDTASYLDALDALALRDRDLRGGLSLLARTMRLVRHVLFFAILVPFAVPGLVLHLPVLLVAVVAGEALTERGDVKATIKMIATTTLVLLTYAAASAFVLLAIPPPAGLVAATVVLGALLLSGWATIKVLERQAILRRGFGLFLTLLQLEAELERLAAIRDGLRARVLGLVDAYADPAMERIVDKAAQHPAHWLDDDDRDAV